MSILTRRNDSLDYDGPGDLARESVLRIYSVYLSGGRWSHDEMRRELNRRYGEGYDATTINKANAILCWHGYAVEWDNAAGYNQYWLVQAKMSTSTPRAPARGLSAPCSCGSGYERAGRCAVCGQAVTVG